jgi:3-hydroxybutyryl-CoA dehydrogenase
MHFFNPPPVMKLVEVVRGRQTSDETVNSTRELAERLGKVTVVCKDTPGFIVNRVARPFYGEALRLLGEGVAPVEEIDRIVRLSGGFKMGPFELMDLIGIDVNYAVTKSVYEQFFHEPRFRPHPIQRQMVEAGTLGRKTKRGFYSYE